MIFIQITIIEAIMLSVNVRMVILRWKVTGNSDHRDALLTTSCISMRYDPLTVAAILFGMRGYLTSTVTSVVPITMGSFSAAGSFM